MNKGEEGIWLEMEYTEVIILWEKEDNGRKGVVFKPGGIWKEG